MNDRSSWPAPLLLRVAFASAALLGLGGAGFQGPLEQPALQSPIAATSPLLALARAGERLVAVGQRGVIVVSDDRGGHWRQAEVPVGSDLVALSFASPESGWAVGHGGVVLRSDDGGQRWVRQFDGHAASRLAIAFFEERAKADPSAARLLQRERSLAQAGGTQAFLDVMFDSPRNGFVVGTFNRIFRTTDGGATWVPWMDRVDNPKELHFYAVRKIGERVYLAGEQGMVWRLDAGAERFVAIQTPYAGTLFGIVDAGQGAERAVLVFGMRGALYRSSDAGSSWQAIDSGSPAGIVGGERLADGRVVLATLAGGMSLSRDQGRSFAAQPTAAPMPYFGLAALPASGRNAAVGIGLVGSEGVRIEALR